MPDKIVTNILEIICETGEMQQVAMQWSCNPESAKWEAESIRTNEKWKTRMKR